VRLLRWYILRQHLVPFLLGFGVITFILEMDVLVDYLDLVVNRGVALGVVAQLFALSLGYIVALSVPCAVLVAVLMTFGRLSQDNEITALRASGINVGSILLGPLAAAALMAAGLTLFNNHVLPATNHAFANLLIDIGRMRPTVKIQEGVFITDFPGYNLLVRSVNGRTNELRGVTIYQTNPGGGPPTTILARTGFLYYTPDGRDAVLELKDGEIHEIPPDPEGSRHYRRLKFRTHIIHIAGAGGVLERTVRDSRSDREMSAHELSVERATLIDQLHSSRLGMEARLTAIGVTSTELRALPADDAPWLERARGALAALTHASDPADALVQRHPAAGPQIDLWRIERPALQRRIASLSVEMHKKFSLPAACVVFVLLGAPIGMRVRRAGPAVAFVSIAFFLFYYLCLVGGEELATRLMLPPWLAMWLPNLLLGAWGTSWTLEACELQRRRTTPAPRVMKQAA
jgi:lipopolysaccharide export system permease protein